MTPKQPPKTAAWLLKHFGSGSDNETLLGDLAEQYLKKHSAMWYWRQAIKAIPVSLFKEIRAHKWLAARTLMTGWFMWIVCGALIFPLAFHSSNVGYYFEPADLIGSAWSFMWMPVLGPTFQGVLYYALATALPLIVGLLCGWLTAHWQVNGGRRPLSIQISQVHRGQRTGMVLVFAGSILLIDLLLFGPFVLRVGTSVALLFAGRLMANFAASVLGIILGGGLFGDHSRDSVDCRGGLRPPVL